MATVYNLVVSDLTVKPVFISDHAGTNMHGLTGETKETADKLVHKGFPTAMERGLIGRREIVLIDRKVFTE